MKFRNFLVSAALAATVIASANHREPDRTDFTIRAGINVDNVSTVVCLDMDRAQVCAFRLTVQPEPVIVISTDSDYRAWTNGARVEF